MADLGTKEKTPSPVAIEKSKEITIFPDVCLNSKMLGDIKDCEIDGRYVLTFVGKVSGLHKPSQYDKSSGMTDKDVIANFKLIDGSIRPYSKDKKGKEI
jgi:hypothetical protein